MALLSVQNISIKGIAACVPKQKEYTNNYSLFTEEEKELFIKSVGITERRVAPFEITTSDMCYHAAEKLIADLQWCKEDIGCLIFVSQSTDYLLPATSIILQHRLQLPNTTMAFDVGLGCSGYVYGLQLMASLLTSGQIKKGLLLVGDKSTLSTHFEDKSTYPLFGDAGCATAMAYDSTAAPIFFNSQSDGAGEDAIKILDGAARNTVRDDTFEIVEVEPGVKRSRRHLALKGIDIFNFALKEVTPNIHELLKFATIEKEQVNYFVFHQANRLINESVRKKLKVLDVSKVPYSIQLFGNTSSASIPLTMVTQLKQKLQDENTLLLSGFGVGYSWSSCVFNSKSIYCSDLIEI
ncbi:MAG: ketoacyl-ACP synthase III [Bacteroidia bacterium]|nr:ketoacyl-ACP synthase III [Bacteroidia bacterium]